ncbi:1,4-alpha-glucan branching protein domain-containing protein [Terriglobus sp.]|uniref:1,4-alpha-glucan branching protein domain-containing protein n=1 Tax=Terriglobus sp. TaxID=1889013 RepID=UPI003AFF6F16
MPGTRGFLNIHLHAHLPFVVNHGTWPHGLEWLHEAAAETYLPLLQVLRRLGAEGIRARWSIDVSPVLLEQLAHPVFVREFPEYLRRKIQFAQEDEAFFAQAGEDHLRWLAQFWQQRYGDALSLFEELKGDLIAALRTEQERGSIDLLTCAATHGYMPLLGTDESVRAQWRVATAVHRRHFGVTPPGVWLPECGYRPAGYWQVPLLPDTDPRAYPGFHRIGVEEALEESSLHFFYADGHLVEGSDRFASPYSAMQQGNMPPPNLEGSDGQLYRSYTVQGSERPSRVAVLPRDPRTGYQVWSGDGGYPADGTYLDFHKKRWPGGHRYWRVTGPNVEMNAKHAYQPHEAEQQAREHARHFIGLVSESIAGATQEVERPVIAAPFDAELFGHWWYEGVIFLEEVTRLLARGEGTADRNMPQMVTPAEYLRREGTAMPLRLPEGSWGAGGDNRVWLNQDTSWTYARIYAAEYELRELCTGGAWRDGGLGERLAKQLCRELLLLESSDWQFLITTGAARDYAERRFREHDDAFGSLLRFWRAWRETGALDQEQIAGLVALEAQDSIFAEVNPEFWVRGAHAEPVPTAQGE